MESSCEAGNARSPKREALPPPGDSYAAARAVAELDDAIWMMSKKLAALLHPREQALWQRLVLQSFDFTSGGCLNTANYQDDHGLKDPDAYSDEEEDDDEDDEEDEDDSEDETSDTASTKEADETAAETEDENAVEIQEKKPADQGGETAAETEGGGDAQKELEEQNPQLVAMRGRYDDMPSEYLEEGLVNWYRIGIFHRPSQYGFLKTLQHQSPEGTWPESEDAFTLFGDIVRLLQLPRGECMGARGEGSDITFKFLAAPTEAGPSSRYYRFYVMKTLGYVLHFWHWEHGIGNEWAGFSKPEAMEATVAKQLVGKNGEDSTGWTFDEEEDKFDFPDYSVRDAKRLFQHVRENCRDWRSVCCNDGYDGYTPVVFVGESKAPSHRWTGYTGKKCWT